MSKSFKVAKRSLDENALKHPGPSPAASPDGEPDLQAADRNAPALLHWTDEELDRLGKRLRQGADVRTRTYMLRKYKACFIGEEAVRWMLSAGLARSADEAVQLGNALMRRQLFHHVTYEHAFHNKYLFYRFLEDEADGKEALLEQDARSFATIASSGDPRAELTRLQRQVAELSAEMEAQKAVSTTLFDATIEQAHGVEKLFGILEQHTVQLSARQSTLSFNLHACMAFQALLAASMLLEDLSPVLQAARKIALLGTLLCLLAAFLGLLGPGEASPGLAPSQQAGAAKPSGEDGREGRSASGRMFSGRLRGLLMAADGQGGLESKTSTRRSGLLAHPSPSLAATILQAPPPPHTVADSEDLESASITYGDSDGELPCRREVEALDVAAPPSKEDFEDWPDAPALLRLKPLVGQTITDPNCDPTRIPLNTGRPVRFESDLFEGCVVLYIAGLPSAGEALFKSQRRKTRLTVQGRFKKVLPFSDVVHGQEFPRAPKNLPARWLVDTVLIKMAQKISPSMTIGPLSAPYLLVPVLAVAQGVVVSRPGEEPDPAAEPSEDMRLYNKKFTDRKGEPWPQAKRRKFFWDAKNRESFSFDTEHVWTFHIYQHLVDLSSYELDLLYRFDLVNHLDGQPLQFMCKESSSGQYLFNFELWHEKLLPAAQAHHARVTAAAASSKASPSPALNPTGGGPAIAAASSKASPLPASNPAAGGGSTSTSARPATPPRGSSPSGQGSAAMKELRSTGSRKRRGSQRNMGGADPGGDGSAAELLQAVPMKEL